MGFYIRKSKKAGPFRFNLSKSGIGTSVGVRGFRVGTGPRGNYMHAGRNGVYYRKQWGGAKRRPQQSVAPFVVGFVLGRLLFLPLLLIGILLLIFAWKALLIWTLVITGIVLIKRHYPAIAEQYHERAEQHREDGEQERERQAELSIRADAQHELAKQGDSAGIYGYYPPATPASPAPLSDAEIKFAEESAGTTFNMFAEDPTPRGVWVLVKTIMDVGGFTEQQANSILDYQFAQHCPAGLPALMQARQALADPDHHQLDHPLANIKRFPSPATGPATQPTRQMSDDELDAYADDTASVTCKMYAKDPTQRGIWPIVKALMDEGFTIGQAGQIIGYQCRRYMSATQAATFKRFFKRIAAMSDAEVLARLHGK